MILTLLLASCTLAATEEKRGPQSYTDEQLIRAARQAGDTDSIRELAHRGKAIHKTVLEDIAEHYEEIRPWSVKDQPKDFLDMQIERGVRNTARLELARLGSERHFMMFVADLSTTNANIQVEAITALAKLGNQAAIKFLVEHLDDGATQRLPSDVESRSVGSQAGAAINSLLGSQSPHEDLVLLAKRGVTDESFVAFWKQWWEKNKPKYSQISFNQGRPKK